MSGDPLFGELALSRGLITREQLDAALAEQARRGEAALGTVLSDQGVITPALANGLGRLQAALDAEARTGTKDENELLGKRLGGCLVLEQIGAGGMGTTYRCHQLRLDREVVLKGLPPRLVKITGNVQRFEREARAAAKLDHPSIVTVFDFDHEGEL